MDCRTRDSLEADVDRAQKVYSDARARFRAGWANATPEEHWVLSWAVSDALMELDVAAGLLDYHTSRHECETKSIGVTRRSAESLGL